MMIYHKIWYIYNVLILGAAAEVCEQEMAYDHAWMEKLSARLMDKIMSRLPQVIRNGDPIQTYPGCINLSFAYVEGKYKQ